MRTFDGHARRGTLGRLTYLKCPRCPFTCARTISDAGFGECPQCQVLLVRAESCMAARRAAKAKADFERMGR